MPYKLLLADDSITIQKVVELVLAEEDFEIKSVGNGEDALSVMNSFRPDIVLADIDMPKVNGYQLCEKIKQDPATANVPVILLAGAFEPIDDELSKKVGADDSVIKPFESQELISKINAALTMVAAGGGGEIAFVETEEEALEIMDEEEAGVTAVEAVSTEEDLWAMEEVSGAPEEFAAIAAEEEQPGIEEAFALAEEEIPREAEPAAPKAAAVRPEPKKEAAVREFAMPPQEDLLRVVAKGVQDQMASYLSSVDLKEAIVASLMPSMKDSIDKILWEIAPELVEKMLKEILKGSISSLTKEVEKVIWETVPDLAGTLISKEIEKIKSEF